MALNRNDLIISARKAMLHAWDEWARDSGLPNLPRMREGAIDADLGAIFPSIDAQVDRLIARSNAPIPDHAPEPAFTKMEMASLIMTGKMPTA